MQGILFKGVMMEMKLTYITIHTMEPEIMKDFYIKYLGAVVDDARPFDRDGSGKDNRVASPSSYGTVYSLSFDGGVKSSSYRNSPAHWESHPLFRPPFHPSYHPSRKPGLLMRCGSPSEQAAGNVSTNAPAN